MRIIIIGASGLVGSNLYSIAKDKGYDVVGTYSSEERVGLVHYDMRQGPLRTVFPDLCSQDVVYILSAYSNPSWIFDHKDEAQNLNLFSTMKLIDEVADAGARIVFMSSVEVFDGVNGNYNEETLPAPLNLYGKMKYEIEKHLYKKKNYTIVRTGWNVGWTLKSRCVVSLTYDTLMKPNARMAKDNIFSIIDVRDTAVGLLKLCSVDSLKICHLAGNQPIYRTELASFIISHSRFGNVMSFKEVLFSEIPYSEPRSCCNHLDNSLAITKLGMAFANSLDVIHHKVDFLDANVTTPIIRP